MATLTKVSNRWRLTLSPTERQQLNHVLCRDPKPYRRERASAILKIAAGQSPHQVAQWGLLKKRDPDTVYHWLKAYVADGILGLSHRGRKKKPRLSLADQRRLAGIINRKTPQDYGSLRCRWSLKTLHQQVPQLCVYRSQSAIWHLLSRMEIAYKRSRDSIESPDPGLAVKIRRIRGVLGYARSHPDEVAMLFLDEFSFYRQPLVGATWWPKGRRKQPKARRSPTANTRGRIVGAINATSGQLSYQMASSITVQRLCEFLSILRAQYRHCQKVYVVLDNWHNVHRHPVTLKTIAELGLIPLFLPTYCPEANPIERLWHQLTDAVLRVHRDSANWQTLKSHVTAWLDQFITPCHHLLQMVGLQSGRAIAVDC